MQLNPLKQIEQELNTRLRQQEVLAELGQRALTTKSLEDLFSETVQLVARTLHVEYCKILELLPDGEALLLRAGVGWKTGYVGQEMVGAERHSQAGFTLMSREPVLVDDIHAETRFSAPPLLLEHNIASGVSVVIPGKKRPFGVLGAHSSQPRQFTQDEANFLKAVAHLLASSVARIAVDNTLRTSRDQLQIILQGVADGITAQAGRGRLIYANDAAAKIIGYTSAQALLDAPLDEVMQKFDLFDEDGNPFPMEN
jgi:GAF domain-containing protein